MFVFGATAPQWARVSSFTRFLDHTYRRTTFGRTPLDEWSARRRDLYLTTHNTNNRQTSMPPWDSNPQSQQASGRRPTARPLGPALTPYGWFIFINVFFSKWKYRSWSKPFICTPIFFSGTQVGRKTRIRLPCFLEHVPSASIIHRFVHVGLVLCPTPFISVLKSGCMWSTP
jgi:hypothetical protein